ncbi:MAG TPA: hypothetical protein VJB60_00805 [Candidatus Peribacterales bacterium]|nr:hypothetical protein [Candidatus Peribacterales bacterium]
MSTIRLTVGKDLARILRELKAMRFPLLNNAEIIRAALSHYYISTKIELDEQSEVPNEELIKSFKESEKHLKNPHKRFYTLDEMMADLTE